MAVSARAQMQYRASFAMLAMGNLLTTGLEFVALLALFDRFGSLSGWSLREVAFMYGKVNVSFSIAEAATRGFDTFGVMVKTGDFDRLLARPRSTALQIAGQELRLSRVGRLAQGMAALIWASASLGIDWTPASVALLIAAIAGGACLFSGLLTLQATMSFWTTETLEIVNTVTYGGVETAQFPISIYRPWFRRVFTFGIPLACLSYFPSLAIMGVEDPLGSPLWFQWASPLAGFAFLLAALQAWRFGVRHYTSTGS